jgi:hypothetical protein
MQNTTASFTLQAKGKYKYKPKLKALSQKLIQLLTALAFL